MRWPLLHPLLLLPLLLSSISIAVRSYAPSFRIVVSFPLLLVGHLCYSFSALPIVFFSLHLAFSKPASQPYGRHQHPPHGRAIPACAQTTPLIPRHSPSPLLPPPRSSSPQSIAIQVRIIVISIYGASLCLLAISFMSRPRTVSWKLILRYPNDMLLPLETHLTIPPLGIYFFPFIARQGLPGRRLSNLQVSVDSNNEALALGIDESYDIQVSDTGGALLHAATVFGAMHGTFVEIFPRNAA